MRLKHQKNISARDAAREVLRRVRRDNAYANLALSGVLERFPSMKIQDRQLATELVYGVLRQQRRLDHAFSRYVNRPFSRLDQEVADAMRLAAYQLLVLDRIPAYAAINDAVEVIRQARGPKMAGFANAVLRKITPGDLTEGLPVNPVERFAIEYSLPDALAQYWFEQIGLDEAQALAASLLKRAPLTARANLLKTSIENLIEKLSQEGAYVEPTSYAPAALKICELSSPFSTPSYLNGLWTAQDEAAQLVAHLVDPQPGEIILDACAGVGGKSTHLATLMGDVGHIKCVDISQRKLELLKEHCIRLQVRSCIPIVADFRQLPFMEEELPSRVLLDAPCSGLGVLRRHPELKWRIDLSILPELVNLQRELITAAIRCVRPGGIFVYSVCTTTEEEGPEQVKWMLNQFAELKLWPAMNPLFSTLASNDGVYRLWPHRHHTDGFFMVRFQVAKK